MTKSKLRLVDTGDFGDKIYEDIKAKPGGYASNIFYSAFHTLNEKDCEHLSKCSIEGLEDSYFDEMIETSGQDFPTLVLRPGNESGLFSCSCGEVKFEILNVAQSCYWLLVDLFGGNS